MPDPVLVLDAVTKEYAGPPPVTAIDGVSLAVESGELVAVVGDPAVVFADEPTGNLDSVTSGEIVDLFLALNAEGSTIVVITHDVELARRFPRQVRLRDGRIES